MLGVESIAQRRPTFPPSFLPQETTHFPMHGLDPCPCLPCPVVLRKLWSKDVDTYHETLELLSCLQHGLGLEVQRFFPPHPTFASPSLFQLLVVIPM